MDFSGNVRATIELDPWGGDTNRSSNQWFQPHMFTSYEREGDGSDYAMNRELNIWFTRFYQPDPFDGSYNLSDPQSFNRYSYVQNDPVNSIDPTGLWTDCKIGSDGNITCVEMGGGPGTRLDGGPIYRPGPRETVYANYGPFDARFSASGILSIYSDGPLRVITEGEPRHGNRGDEDQPREYMQGVSHYQSEQQRGFDDCARNALHTWRMAYLRTGVEAAGAGILIGGSIRILNSGVPGTAGALGATGAAHAINHPLPGDNGFMTAINALDEVEAAAKLVLAPLVAGVGLAGHTVTVQQGNDAKLKTAIEGCKEHFPGAPDAFLNTRAVLFSN